MGATRKGVNGDTRPDKHSSFPHQTGDVPDRGFGQNTRGDFGVDLIRNRGVALLSSAFDPDRRAALPDKRDRGDQSPIGGREL